MELDVLDDEASALDRLCELNVLDQARNVCRTTVVQEAWKRGQEQSIHAWIYRLSDGLLKDLDFCVAGPDHRTTTTAIRASCRTL